MGRKSKEHTYQEAQNRGKSYTLFVVPQGKQQREDAQGKYHKAEGADCYKKL